MGYVKCVNRDTFEETPCPGCPANIGLYDACLNQSRKNNTWIVDENDNIVWQWGEPRNRTLAEMKAKRKMI